MLRYLLFASVLGLALSSPDFASDVGKHLQEVTVTVEYSGTMGRVSGSGSLFTKIIEGKETTWVLTAAHVVESARVVGSYVDPTEKTEKKRVSYNDLKIIQEHVEGGRVVGEINYDAKVICADYRRDIAVLRVRKTGKIVEKGATLYLGDDVPGVGTDVFHCGSPGGKDIGGTATLTSGIISRVGVRLTEFSDSEVGIYDQADCASLPGSSGGLIALKSDGQIIGILVIGLRGSDSFAWYVPARTIKAFAKEANLLWLFDPNAQAIPESEIGKIPLELSPPESRTTRLSESIFHDIMVPDIKSGSMIHAILDSKR